MVTKDWAEIAGARLFLEAVSLVLVEPRSSLRLVPRERPEGSLPKLSRTFRGFTAEEGAWKAIAGATTEKWGRPMGRLSFVPPVAAGDVCEPFQVGEVVADLGAVVGDYSEPWPLESYFGHCRQAAEFLPRVGELPSDAVAVLGTATNRGCLLPWELATVELVSRVYAARQLREVVTPDDVLRAVGDALEGRRLRRHGLA